MSWKDVAKPKELEKLQRLREKRDIKTIEYNDYYGRLMRRCQSRLRRKPTGGVVTNPVPGRLIGECGPEVIIPRRKSDD